MDELIIVSVDSHAQAPPESWAEYLEPQFHEYLPSLHEENEIYTTVFEHLSGRISHDPAMRAIFDTDGRLAGGGHLGIWDLETRLAEMDVEGIAGEFVYPGDHRATSIFFNTFNRARPPRSATAVSVPTTAGSTTRGRRPRPLSSSAAPPPASTSTPPWPSWTGSRRPRFKGTYVPGYSSYPDIPSLSDEYWEPVWPSEPSGAYRSSSTPATA